MWNFPLLKLPRKPSKAVEGLGSCRLPVCALRPKPKASSSSKLRVPGEASGRGEASAAAFTQGLSVLTFGKTDNTQLSSRHQWAENGGWIN